MALQQFLNIARLQWERAAFEIKTKKLKVFSSFSLPSEVVFCTQDTVLNFIFHRWFQSQYIFTNIDAQMSKI